ncbi:hypothetical protein [Erwinia amylovora]|uniref:hypothetical protein n=2 Tax=Erwinia amylovora TaxID=552 RepID=UPI001443DB9E|nr:hypothetical protein [Erwinia amylovora]
MTRKFHEIEIKKIVPIIKSWKKSEFSRSLLCIACKPLLGKTPTRQALCKHEEIAIAYKIRKRSVSLPRQDIKLPGSLAIAAERIMRLENDNKSLILENTNLLLMIRKMHENAYRNNISISLLEEELPQRPRK